MAEQSTEVGLAYYDGWQKQLADLRAENSRLSAEVERMRGVLESVEWEGQTHYGGPGCPLCSRAWADNTHKPSCPLGRALGRPECVSSADGGEARE